MRHFLANVVTYCIALLLLGGAALFAWGRAAQVLITREPAVLAAYAPADDTGFRWQALGADSYIRNCSTCHLRDGSGWDQYPALGRSASFVGTAAGRDYVVDLHIYGLASERWRAPMPPMEHLSDVEMAAVINHVLTRFGDAPVAEDRLYRPEDIAERRGQSLTPTAVAARRPE